MKVFNSLFLKSSLKKMNSFTYIRASRLVEVIKSDVF